MAHLLGKQSLFLWKKEKKENFESFNREIIKWSVLQDLNLRPLRPKRSALPSCAKHRHRHLKWCGRRDLNSHTLRYWNLNPARLPIPPLPQKMG